MSNNSYDNPSSEARFNRRKLLQSLGAAGAVMAVGSVGAAIAHGKSADWEQSGRGNLSVTESVYPGHPNPDRHGTEGWYDVKRLGAVGDGVTDDTGAFEQALLHMKMRGGGVVYVPPGQYVITRVLRLYSHTTIKMEDGAVLKKLGNPDSNLKLFVNGDIGDAEYASGYGGDGNITVIGGTIDLCGNTFPPTNPSRNYQAFGIAHADSVHIERVRFINGHNGHIIEFNSSRNVKLLHCLFQDQVVASTGQYEMVQIDFASAEAFPTFGAFDDTPCCDVLIEGCTFVNGHRGVGTHGSKYDSAGKQVFHSNIRIVNNYFNQIADIAIKPESYRNAVVAGNTIENTGSAGIAVYSCRNTIIANNTVSYAGLHGITISRKTSSVFDEPSADITVCGNVLNNIAFSPFRIIGGAGIVVDGNIGSTSNREGAYITNTDDLVLRNNVFRGVGQAQHGQYYGIRADNCSNVDIAGNSLSNAGYTNNYKYAIYIPAGSTGVKISGNTAAPGVSGTIRSDSADAVIAMESGERMLTGSLNVSSGTVVLNDDITKYRTLIIATGSVSGGGLRHEIARGWYTSGFRPGTDFLNVATSGGKLVASIDTHTQLTVVSASDPLRYVIGVL
ncbi:right-handed parallel beta-helix repeat-containing protein [Paenibacillus sp. GYB004]|uniref:right-handed parallel beta-helix repeat-containing protein n=1 Tax=Paenibacillus sp. GYB004 TaxID=2994393 RepID=UPI002F9644DF